MLINDVEIQEITPFLKVRYVCKAKNNEKNVATCISELSNLLTIKDDVSVYFENTDLMFKVDDILNKFNCLTTIEANLDYNVLTVILK